MIISVTERGSFRRCKRMWDYSSFNRQGLEPFVPPTALSFGTMIHKCHEEWMLHSDTPINDVVMRVAAQGLRDLKQRYVKAIGVEPADEELDGYFKQVTLALEMMNNYQTRWGSSLPDGYTLLKPEQTILVPIPGTEHECETCVSKGTIWTDGPEFARCPECHGDGEVAHQLEATLDALIADEGGQLWVLERKTFGNHPKVETLQMNDQFLGYLWALTQLNIGPVGGVFYDGMWKRTLDGKRTLDQLFMREPLLRTPEEISNFGLQLRDEALDMAQPDLRIYPNRAWTGCWDCKFENLCTAQSREEDVDYVKARYFVSRTQNEWQREEAAD